MKKLSLFGLALLLFVFLLIPAYLGYGEQEVIEEWIAAYDYGNSRDKPVSIATDHLGNVYVTGASHTSETETRYDYATVKYGADGTEIWSRRYNNPENGHDTPTDMVVDSSGNVYVTGTSRTFSTATDYFTIKYDTDGDTLWEARYNGPVVGYPFPFDEATAITVDSSGNVYVTGRSKGSDYHPGYLTIKYNSLGEELWKIRYDGIDTDQDMPSDIAVDSSENVYVTGKSYRGIDHYPDYVTIKYNSEGKEQWNVRIHRPLYAPGVYGDDPSISVDASDDIIVMGNIYSAETDWGFITVKYDTNGELKWTTREDEGTYDCYMALDQSGNIYVTGGVSNNIITIKYNSVGEKVWISSYSGPGLSFDAAKGIAVDPSGNAYITGYSIFTLNRWKDYVTVKYDSNGNEVWVATYDGPAVESNDEAVGIVLDLSRNVFVTGCSGRVNVEEDYVTIKYSQKLPPEEQIQVLIDKINNYINSGLLSQQKATGVLTLLNKALAFLEDGDTAQAIGQLLGFRGSVNALTELTAEERQELKDAADNVITELGG